MAPPTAVSHALLKDKYAVTRDEESTDNMDVDVAMEVKNIEVLEFSDGSTGPKLEVAVCEIEKESGTMAESLGCVVTKFGLASEDLPVDVSPKTVCEIEMDSGIDVELRGGIGIGTMEPDGNLEVTEAVLVSENFPVDMPRDTVCEMEEDGGLKVEFDGRDVKDPAFVTENPPVEAPPNERVPVIFGRMKGLYPWKENVPIVPITGTLVGIRQPGFWVEIDVMEPEIVLETSAVEFIWVEIVGWNLNLSLKIAQSKCPRGERVPVISGRVKSSYPVKENVPIVSITGEKMNMLVTRKGQVVAGTW